MGWGIAGDGRHLKPSTFRVLMFFKQVFGTCWRVQFLDADCRNTYPLRLRFEYPDKILEMHSRWGADRRPEDIHALEFGIQRGRGNVWLVLSVEEHRTLQSAK
jgi:hypothetical protein